MLKTVRVPVELEPIFAGAEALVSRYFNDRKDDAEHGTIEISGERYVLVRAASLSVEFFSLVNDLYGAGREREADEFARNILFDLAHAIGSSDAHNFHAKMGLSDPIAKLSAGPVHFSHTGWAFVDISPESRPVPSEDFYLLFDHPFSFESDAWERAGRKRSFPVCIMSSGYSSGWCQESFGVTLVATEVLCRARGDDCCRFIMAHPRHIERHLERWTHLRADKSGGASDHQIPDFFSRKRVEEDLRRARDDLELRVLQRTAELKREVEERQEIEARLAQTHKLEAIGRLAGGIAHDFNNLMAVVLGNCGLLRKKLAADSEACVFVDEIEATGMRAAALTQQLMTFSRGRSTQREALALDEVVREVARMLDRVIGEDVRLVVALSEAPSVIRSDRAQIEQVVMNLAVNARDAMKRGGTLTIATRPASMDVACARELDVTPGDFVLLEVTDTGVGMDEETSKRIFEPFFTTKSGGAGASGTGLGLSIVYGIVKQAGGAITVTTAPGQGACFSVYLPRVEAGGTPAQRSDAAAPRGGDTILLVEDQAELRKVLTRSLGELGYTVIEARDPRHALSLAEEPARQIDLLLTDVVMPQMSGPDLVRAAREVRPTMRVVYMSGYANEGVLSGLEQEAAGWLSKPFSTEELARKIRAVLDAQVEGRRTP